MNKFALFGVLVVLLVLVSGCVEEKTDQVVDSVGLDSDIVDSESLASDLNESELDSMDSDIGSISSSLE